MPIKRDDCPCRLPCPCRRRRLNHECLPCLVRGRRGGGGDRKGGREGENQSKVCAYQEGRLPLPSPLPLSREEVEAPVPAMPGKEEERGRRREGGKEGGEPKRKSYFYPTTLSYANSPSSPPLLPLLLLVLLLVILLLYHHPHPQAAQKRRGRLYPRYCSRRVLGHRPHVGSHAVVRTTLPSLPPSLPYSHCPARF